MRYQVESKAKRKRKFDGNSSDNEHQDKQRLVNLCVYLVDGLANKICQQQKFNLPHKMMPTLYF